MRKPVYATVKRILLFLLLSLPGCAYFWPAPSPIGTTWYRHPQKNHEILLILLPGRYSEPRDFAEEGFITLLRDSGLPADAVAVDAHLGYYLHRNLVTRLHEDVIEPARARGYRHLWLVGISMGGLGATWYDSRRPDDVSGLLLLSPYLGDAEVVDEVAEAGGIRGWKAPPPERSDFQHDIWRMLKGYEKPDRTAGRVFIGYGLQDGFARSNALFAELLPPRQVFPVAGGHDWPVWRELWRMLLRCPEPVRASVDP